MAFRYTSTGGALPKVYTKVSGEVPTGTILNEDGSITGTYTEVGTYNWRVRVTDARNRWVELDDECTITGTPVPVSYIGNSMFMSGLVPALEQQFVIGYKEDVPFAQMTVDIQPPSVGRGGGWSPDGEHFIAPHDASPFFTLYKRTGSSLAKMVDPTTTSSRDIGWAGAWNPASTRLAFCQRGNNTGSFPYVIIYSRSGDTYTQVAQIQDITTGLNQARSVSYSGDGSLLALQTTENPGLKLYTVVGDVYTKQVGFGTVPSGAGRFVSFGGEYLMYSCSAVTGVNFYKVNGSALTLLNQFDIQFGTGTCAWNADNTKCAVIGATSTGRSQLYVYSRTGDVFSLHTTDILTSDGTGTGTSLTAAACCFTHDRLLVSLENASVAEVPSVRVYDSTSFARIPSEDFNFPLPSVGEFRPAEKGIWSVTVTEIV